MKKQKIILIIALLLSYSQSKAQPYWDIAGNTNLTGTGILGSTIADGYRLDFYTNGAGKMTLLSGGNLGIGITTPQNLLHLNASGEEFLIAIKTVYEGRKYFSPHILDIIIEIGNIKHRLREANEEVSDFEKQILLCIVGDMLTKEIAIQLHHSIYSIEAHRKALLRRFNVRTTAALIHIVENLGLLD